MERMIAMVLVLVLVPWVIACSHPHHHKKGKHDRLKERGDSHASEHIVRKLSQEPAKPSGHGELARMPLLPQTEQQASGDGELARAAESAGTIRSVPEGEIHRDGGIGNGFAERAVPDSDRWSRLGAKERPLSDLRLGKSFASADRIGSDEASFRSRADHGNERAKSNAVASATSTEPAGAARGEGAAPAVAGAGMEASDLPFAGNAGILHLDATHIPETTQKKKQDLHLYATHIPETKQKKKQDLHLYATDIPKPKEKEQDLMMMQNLVRGGH